MDWINEFGITMSVDAHRRHHKGRGVDGGQFTKEDGEGGRGGSGSGTKGIRGHDAGEEEKGDEVTSRGSAASARFAEVKEELTKSGLEPLPESFKFRTRDEIGDYSAKVIAAARTAGHLITEDQIPYIKDLSERELGSEDDHDDGKDIGGEEHRVYIDEENNRVYKITRGPYFEGAFGLSKDAHDYLRRLEIAAQLWPSLGYKFEGVIDKTRKTTYDNNPSAVIATSMNRISGVQPTQEEIDDWFTDKGWVPVEDVSSEELEDYQLGWRDPETGTIISDTHPGNFLKTSAGLVPIDVNIREVDSGRAMSLTPAQQALYANQITRDCLIEAGDDVDAGLAAAEYILSTQPVPLSVEDQPRDKVGRWTNNFRGLDPYKLPKIDLGRHNQAKDPRRNPIPYTSLEDIGYNAQVEQKAFQPVKSPVTRTMVDASKIRSSQQFIEPDQLADLIKHKPDKRLGSKKENPIYGVLLEDGSVVIADGNHRTLAAMIKGDKEVEVDLVHWQPEKQTFDPPPVTKPGILGRILGNRAKLISLSVDALLAHDIHNPAAQGILNRALKAARGLSAAARKDLAIALRAGASDSGGAIVKFVDKYRLQLARLLSATQLAAVLEGAREVAAKVPPLGTVPIEGLPVAEQERIIEAARKSEPIVPPKPPKAQASRANDSPEEVHLATIDEAVKELSEKKVMDRKQYDALDAAARAKSFTVAGVDAEETLTKIRDALAENMAAGADYETFKSQVLSAVDSGTFLSDAHQETVFRTNVQSAFSDGQAAVLAHPLVRSGFPYSAYDAIHDDRVRENHLALEHLGIAGTNVYRNDDPVFQLFRPPWDYNDRCSWTPITVRHAAERGIPEAKEWLDTGVEPAQKSHVPMPPFEPPPGFQRAVSAAPLSIQLSMKSMTKFGEDDYFSPRDMKSMYKTPPIEWTKEDYPRNTANQFLDKMTLVDAAANPDLAVALRESTPEEHRWKFDRALAHIQAGGAVHHPSENPGLAVGADGKIADPEWADYAAATAKRGDWEAREQERVECCKSLDRTIKLVRRKDVDFDAVDESLREAGATAAELRALSRLRHKAGDDEKESLRNKYEDAIEAIYARLEKEAEEDEEPDEPKEPAPRARVADMMFSTDSLEDSDARLQLIAEILVLLFKERAEAEVKNLDVALANFNPNEPREPKGIPIGGEWTYTVSGGTPGPLAQPAKPALKPTITPLSPSFEAQKAAVKATASQALGKPQAAAPTTFEGKQAAVVAATNKAMGKGAPSASKAKAVTKPEQSAVFNSYVRGDKSSEEIIGAGDSGGGGTVDKFMELVNKETGFDAKPQLVTKDELDKHITLGGVELYRGVGGKGGNHAQYVDQFKSGDLFAGTGIYGNGTYVAVQSQEDWDKNNVREGYQMAKRYAGDKDEGLMRMSLKTDAKSIGYKEVESGVIKDLARLNKEYTKADPKRQAEIKREADILSDHGRWAQLHGYDVMTMPTNVAMVVLNRGALLVQKEAVQ